MRGRLAATLGSGPATPHRKNHPFRAATRMGRYDRRDATAPTPSVMASSPSGGAMQDVETVIIGAGQAGLATAQRLRKRGRECVVLDHNQRIGDDWRQQWDSLRLYSPAKFDGLPGTEVPRGPVVLPDQGRRGGLPRVLRRPLGPAGSARHPGRAASPVRPDGRFVVTTDAGPIHCDNVVVATGTFGRTPSIPDYAAGPGSLDPAAALQRVPATRAAPGRAGPRGRRLALRHRHRLRARGHAADHSRRT